MFFLAFDIYCFNPIISIFYLPLIYNVIVTNLNFVVFSIFLLTIFSQYLKLSYIPTGLLLEAYS